MSWEHHAVRQTRWTICSLQGTRGLRVQEGVLQSMVKQPTFANTYYRKSGPFQSCYQQSHTKCCAASLNGWSEIYEVLLLLMQVLGLYEPFIYVPMFKFVCLTQIWTFQPINPPCCPLSPQDDVCIDWHLMIHSPRRTDAMSEAVKGRAIFISNSSQDIGNGWHIHQLSQTAEFSWCSMEFYYSLIDSAQ